MNNNHISKLADQAHSESVKIYNERMQTEHPSNVIFYNIFNQRFAELILQEAISACGSQADKKNIRKLFSLPIESDVKYPGPELSTSITSQYTREYNLPRN